MSKTVKKWVFAALRLLVCAVALAWVLHSVTYYDYATLIDGRTVRMIEMGEVSVTVRDTDEEQHAIDREAIARKPDGAEDIQYGLRTTWLKAEKSTLLLCVLLFAPVTFIQSLRFQWMLRAQEINISYFESAKLCFAGNFLNYLTALGSTGGDVRGTGSLRALPPGGGGGLEGIPPRPGHAGRGRQDGSRGLRRLQVRVVRREHHLHPWLWPLHGADRGT